MRAKTAISWIVVGVDVARMRCSRFFKYFGEEVVHGLNKQASLVTKLDQNVTQQRKQTTTTFHGVAEAYSGKDVRACPLYPGPGSSKRALHQTSDMVRLCDGKRNKSKTGKRNRDRV